MAINMNQAHMDDLMKIEHIGRSRAETIVQIREQNGGYLTLKDLKSHSDLPTSMWEKLEEEGIISFESECDSNQQETLIDKLNNRMREMEQKFSREKEEMLRVMDDMHQREEDTALLHRRECEELAENLRQERGHSEETDNLKQEIKALTSRMKYLETEKTSPMKMQSRFEAHQLPVKTETKTWGGKWVDNLAPGGVYRKQSPPSNFDREVKRTELPVERGPLPPKMATYDGKAEWTPFELQFTRIARRYNWGQLQKLDKLIESLRDKALKFYSTCTPAVQNNFDELVAKLKKRFDKKDLPHTIRRRLQELKQSDETLEEFAEKVQELVIDGYPDAPEVFLQTIAIDTFLKGCEDKRGALTAMDKDPKTLDEAVQLVKTAMHNQRLVLGSKRASEVRKVRFEESESEEEGYEVKVLKNNRPDRIGKLETEVCRIQEQLTETTKDVKTILSLLSSLKEKNGRSASPMRCYGCNEEGHVRSRCPNQSRSPSPKPKMTLREVTMYDDIAREPMSLMIPIKINGMHTKALVDTAAQVTVVSEDFARKMKNPIKLSEPVLLKGAGQGSQIKACHGRGVKLQVGKNNFTWDTVVADISDPIILGLDFLTTHKMSIDLEKLSVKLGGEELVCSLVETNGRKESCVAKITLAKRTVVPPFSAVRTHGKSSNASSSETMMVQPSHELKGLLAPRCVVEAGSDIPILLRNVTPQFITLKKEHLVGMATAVDIVDDESETDKLGPSVRAVTSVNFPEQELPEHVQDLFERSTKELTAEKTLEVKELLVEFQDIFAKDDFDLGHFTEIKHKVETGSAVPIRQKMRRTPLGFEQEEEKHLASMLEKGIIQPSSSAWASAPVLVRKKDGTVRYCIDFRAVNNVTRKDAFPLPKIESCLDALSGNLYFSTLDMAAGYWQIEVEEEDRHKLAFITKFGLFEHVRLPFGLCNSPATFQRVIQHVLRGLTWKECLAYLDDVMVLGKTFGGHMKNLRQVLQRFRDHSLKLKPRKCHLFQRKVGFLGKVVSDEGVSINPESISAVLEWPVPRSKKDVESFLGFVNYHRDHVRGFAGQAESLHALTRGERDFTWSEEQDSAFTGLKNALVQAPVLGYPNPEDPFILDTDASDTAIGAELSQIQGGKEVVISYGSKVLTPAQRKYCTTRKELLAVITFTRQNRMYLLGRKFIVRTDHNSLIWLLNFRRIEGQLARWIEELSQYDMTIQHRSGSKHSNADGLSRRADNIKFCECYEAGADISKLPCGGCKFCNRAQQQWSQFEDNVDEIIPLAVREIGALSTTGEQDQMGTGKESNWMQNFSMLELRQKQEEDPDLRQLISWKEQDYQPEQSELQLCSPCIKHFWLLKSQLVFKDQVLFYNWEGDDQAKRETLFMVPAVGREEVLFHCHDARSGSHFGQKKTLERLKRSFMWFGMSTDCIRYVKTCGVCNKNKKPSVHAKAGLGTFHAGSPLERIHIDILGPLVESCQGNKYILVIIDQFTKWIECYALPNQLAETVARTAVDGFISRLGAPLQIHTDQGRNFESFLFKRLCDKLQIAKTRTTPYHPRSNGQVERYNAVIMQAIRCYTKGKQADWDKHLQQIAGAIRATQNRQTGFTPNRMMLGREVSQPIDLMMGTLDSYEEPLPPGDYVQNLEKSLKEVHEIARQNLKEAQARQKRTYDLKLQQKTYQLGDLVYKTNSVSKVGQSKKLQSPWKGPYIVTQVISPVLFRIKNRKSEEVIHHDRLKLCQDRDIPTWISRLKQKVLESSPDCGVIDSTVDDNEDRHCVAPDTDDESSVDNESGVEDAQTDDPSHLDADKEAETNGNASIQDLDSMNGKRPKRTRRLPSRLGDYILSDMED